MAVTHWYIFFSDGKVGFANGLSDINALRGKSAELVCTLNTDKVDGVWYKNGEKVCLLVLALHMTGFADQNNIIVQISSADFHRWSDDL